MPLMINQSLTRKLIDIIRSQSPRIIFIKPTKHNKLGIRKLPSNYTSSLYKLIDTFFSKQSTYKYKADICFRRFNIRVA
ncbi:hypothetical protein BLX41_23985 [Pseudomonas protegens]|nr:hypothetical protein BLX41_23985 [Pseudomonas protegens]